MVAKTRRGPVAEKRSAGAAANGTRHGRRKRSGGFAIRDRLFDEIRAGALSWKTDQTPRAGVPFFFFTRADRSGKTKRCQVEQKGRACEPGRQAASHTVAGGIKAAIRGPAVVRRRKRANLKVTFCAAPARALYSGRRHGQRRDLQKRGGTSSAWERSRAERGPAIERPGPVLSMPLSGARAGLRHRGAARSLLTLWDTHPRLGQTEVKAVGNRLERGH